MPVLRTFIEHASNIWWGIILALVVTASLYLIIYTLAGNRGQLHPLSFLIAIPLLVLLSIQSYLLLGAISIKHSCDEISTWIDAFVPEQPNETYSIPYSREDVNQALSQLASTFPFITTLVDADDIATSGNSSLGEAITKRANSYLNWYIVRRLAWSLGFILLASLGILALSGIQKPSTAKTYSQRRNQRRVNRRPRR